MTVDEQPDLFDEAADSFRGWFKARGTPWRCVCSAASRSECWARLLRLLPTLSRSGGESMVRESSEGPPS